MRRAILFTLVFLSIICLSTTAHTALVLDDPLQGSTTGARGGGTFVTGGWKVTGQHDYIYWHIPTISKGAAEFSVKGLNPNESRAGMEDKSELFHMYDYTFGNSDINYNGGYRDNPYKHFIRKTGVLGSYNNSIDALELVWKISSNYDEPDTSVLSWNPNTTYLFREEWGPDGNGNSYIKTYRDGVLLKTITLPGSWTPYGHSVRIAASTRRAADFGAPIDAIFSNVKVWDLSGPPSPPAVTLPVNGRTVNTRTPLIQWTGDPQTQYQVRVNTVNSPDSGIVWDSGQVPSIASSTYTGTLPDKTNYYVFVRLANSQGWSGWSAAGYWFRVDTSYVQPGGGMVSLYGNALQDDGGPFLGLGVTYMSALRFCKYDRNRLHSDLSLLSQNGFKFVRVLSMVGWYEAWDGKEIAPISFYSRSGKYVPAWTDYWQQLRDLIDITYDQYGMRTELTIFADAQLMPNKSDRINHMQQILNNLAGREHKVILLEVANEAWQNGFPGSQGIADLREFGQYLGTRTNILVALSDSEGGDNASIEQLYSGSAADIATEHFTRDTSENGWLPVRGCWDVEYAQGVPPASSNEPIGPGSSVSSENDPIKLVSAAVYAWIAKLPMYVYHTSAGVFADTRFENMSGLRDYIHLADILPPDMPNWTRNDGKETAAPFTMYCMGQADKYWTDISNATNGCHRNIGGIKNNEFVCYPQGILSGGVTLKARRQVTFKVYNPLTGAVVMDTITKNAGEQFTLSQGPGAYIIKGTFIQDVTPPGPVTNFTATAGDMMNTLSWTNPSTTDFSGTMIRYKTSGYPTSPADGTFLVERANAPGSSDTFVHTGLTSGITFYYSAFAHDGSLNYASAVNASATPWQSPRVTISDCSFTSGVDGWSTAVWRSGSYSYGTMEWNSSAGYPGGCMRSTGIGDSDNADRGTREGGEIWKVISTAGFRNIKVFWDTRVGSLGPEFTGTGYGVGALDHDLIEEQLTVSYSTDAGATWSEAHWLNRSDLLWYQSYGNRQIDLSAISDCSENANFALRFRWQLNGRFETGDFGDLDNILVTGTPLGSTITGHLELEGYSGDITQVPINVELRKHGGATDTRTIYLDGDGNFTIADVESGIYDLAFKASHWLQKVIPDVQVGG